MREWAGKQMKQQVTGNHMFDGKDHGFSLGFPQNHPNGGTSTETSVSLRQHGQHTEDIQGWRRVSGQAARDIHNTVSEN